MAHRTNKIPRGKVSDILILVSTDKRQVDIKPTLLCGLALRCRMVKHDTKIIICTYFHDTDLYQEYGLMNLGILLFLGVNSIFRHSVDLTS